MSWKGVLALLFGSVAGVASALWGISSAAYNTGSGYWQGDLAIGSTNANRYTRARIARRGLLALSREEAIYFFRDRDDTGRPLTEECAYAVSGGDLPALWWSITLYAGDDFLAQNNDKAHAISSFTIKASDEADWKATIKQSQPTSSQWISSQNSGAFSLTLRLYEPYEAPMASPSSIAFPSVKRISCAEPEPSP